ncbi:MAG: biotin--[acetyl-CoA-carboxylase] ligase, partial [Planctomycetota bacterium]
LDGFGVRAEVRWPNDLLLGGRKVAGLLLETRDFDPRAPLFILGAGINTALVEEDLPEDLRPLVTSVLRETGEAPDRHDLLLSLHEGILDACGRATESPDDVEEAYRGRAAHLGEAVSLLDGSTPRTGVLRDVSPVTGVVLEEAGGATVTVKAEHAREIRLAGPSPGHA